MPVIQGVSPGISVIEAYHAESDGESSTTSGTYQNKTTLTFTAKAGNYLISFYSESYNGDVRIYNSTDAVTLAEMPELSSLNYTPMGGIANVTLTAGSKTFYIQWLSNGGSAYIRRARLFARRL